MRYRSAMICNGALPQTPLKGYYPLRIPFLWYDRMKPLNERNSLFSGSFFFNSRMIQSIASPQPIMSQWCMVLRQL